ncbi:hypothetical protein [Dyadobacter jejuensis]|nr:hypothetical protein [Dyadobacter jejuensis]
MAPSAWVNAGDDQGAVLVEGGNAFQVLLGKVLKRSLQKWRRPLALLLH